MTSVEELKNALKETLEQRGVLNQIKAIMRQEIYEAIESDDSPKPQLSKENLIINELIKDYLNYNNLSHTSPVFQSETGQPKDVYDRNSLSKELNIIENEANKQQPLLYSILFGLKKQDYNLVTQKDQ
jgi:lisH domain-containing protein FOPNL